MSHHLNCNGPIKIIRTSISLLWCNLFYDTCHGMSSTAHRVLKKTRILPSNASWRWPWNYYRHPKDESRSGNQRGPLLQHENTHIVFVSIKFYNINIMLQCRYHVVFHIAAMSILCFIATMSMSCWFPHLWLADVTSGRKAWPIFVNTMFHPSSYGTFINIKVY